MALPGFERAIERRKHLRPGTRKRIERAGLDHAFQHPLI